MLCLTRLCNFVQEDFLEVTHDYPEAWRSMDLVAEHRLRMLRTSGAFAKWQSLQKTQPNASSKLSIKIEQVLEVSSIRNSRLLHVRIATQHASLLVC